MRRFLYSLFLPLLLAAFLQAHPVPRDNRDRTIVVRATADALIVDYRLEVDEGSLARELTREEAAKVTSRADLLEIFSQAFAATCSRNLDASLDGEELHFNCVQRKFAALDHVRCDYRFVAPWSLKPGVEHKLKFHECNYVVDDFSSLKLYLGADESVRIVSAKAPDADLMKRTSDQRKPGDGDRLRRAEARFRLANNEPSSVYRPAFPPDELPYKNEPDGDVSAAKSVPNGDVSASKSTPAEAVGTAKLPQPEAIRQPTALLPAPSELPDASGASSIAAPTSFWDRLHDPDALLHLLLDSRQGLFLMLLAAALFGAAHALTPGHGKTLVAAYLVGERGTFWHALLLGIVVTVTHTAAVIVIAAVVWFVPGSEKLVFTLQGLIGGFLIMGLGLWLLIRRLSGQADHFHFGAGRHHHGHDHAHGHADHVHLVLPASAKAGFWQVVTLGIGGGLLPCVDAVVLLGFAFSSGIAHLALPLLLAFSAGLATVLVVLGLMVVGAKHLARRTDASGGRWQGLARVLPILSALFVTLMGFWLCYGALAAK